MANRRTSLPIVAALLLFSLSACTQLGITQDKNKYAGRLCPDISIVRDLERQTVFVQGGGEDLTEVVYDIRMSNLQAACDFDDEVTEVSAQLQVTASRGPANTDRRARYEFFVAVINSQGQVTAREVFASEIEFLDNRRRVGKIESFVPKLPIEIGKPEDRSRILVGLKLTKAQLDYNRRNR